MSKPVVYIVIYSLYHHVYKLSLSIKEGNELPKKNKNTKKNKKKSIRIEHDVHI